jgi:hypothetical protein
VKNVALATLYLAIGVLSCQAGGDDQFSVAREECRETTLVSWTKDHGWSFQLVPESDFDSFIDHFYPEMRGVGNLPELEAALAKLPKGSTVAWRTWPPLKLTYPPAELVERVKRFAKAKELDLQMLPSVD